MTNGILKYPLTIRAITESFADLRIDRSLVEIQKATIQEAVVAGVWRESALRKAFAKAGFKPVGKKDRMAFTNADDTVGLVCYGVEVHPSANRFITFNFEIQARTKKQAAQGIMPAMIFS